MNLVEFSKDFDTRYIMHHLDLWYDPLLEKYGTEKTIKILKLEGDPRYEEALAEDRRYRRSTLPACRRVISLVDQIQAVEAYTPVWERRRAAIAADNPTTENIDKFISVQRDRMEAVTFIIDQLLKHEDVDKEYMYRGWMTNFIDLFDEDKDFDRLVGYVDRQHILACSWHEIHQRKHRLIRKQHARRHAEEEEGCEFCSWDDDSSITVDTSYIDDETNSHSYDLYTESSSD